MLALARSHLGRIAALRPAWVYASLFFGLLYVATAFHLDERLFYTLKTTWHESTWERRSLWLPEYRVKIDALPVTSVKDNLSGLTYDERRDHLWAVVNNPEELLALGRDGSFIARYPLQGFEDVEGVTYLGEDLLVLTEERKQSLVVVQVPRVAGPLRRAEARSITLALADAENAGFEGVGYDRAGDRLFVVKEHSPRKLYEIQGIRRSLAGDMDIKIIDREAWIEKLDMASDLSSVHFDEQTGHLMLLSDEAKMMLELDAKGELVSFRSLWSGFAGLERSVPQPEGMTFDAQGNLYLVSEPNLFYAFEQE
ncbi:SdiA-regulated domain-containing protein [Pseudomonas stutzeri]|uniref:DNA-binding protein n=1 Tax=Stutzerimonas stutzeri TaxID=316 RepID=A0A2N8S1H6_STUST|nr:SdiA-regulated domain-containing protein [Stutzerimonas stutzeri]MCQ4295635.1 SdiA-regulated domain-containing protein [Stutzerimonas stutzeri]PNF80476.1 DNA-binding protein [Stutzerimonas stutzeri]